MGLTQDIGNRSERAAAEWLMDHGFSLLHTNWRHGRYELDIVAAKGGNIHFVEVKSRRAGSLTTPEEAFTPAKFRALCNAAAAYIAAYGVELEPQFDLIAVYHTPGSLSIRYIPEVMSPRW